MGERCRVFTMLNLSNLKRKVSTRSWAFVQPDDDTPKTRRLVTLRASVDRPL